MKKMTMINSIDKTCVTCYWFRAKDDDAMNRSCTYIDEITGSTKIEMTTEIFDVPGEKKLLSKSRCGMWKSCGIEGKFTNRIYL